MTENLKAGPKLDALVARDCNPRCEVNRTASVEDFKAWCVEFNFHPSTSIAVAWEMVEKPELEFNWLEKNKDGYCACFSKKRAITAFANTAPLAICLAALKTVEGK